MLIGVRPVIVSRRIHISYAFRNLAVITTGVFLEIHTEQKRHLDSILTPPLLSIRANAQSLLGTMRVAATIVYLNSLNTESNTEAPSQNARSAMEIVIVKKTSFRQTSEVLFPRFSASDPVFPN